MSSSRSTLRGAYRDEDHCRRSMSALLRKRTNGQTFHYALFVPKVDLPCRLLMLASALTAPVPPQPISAALTGSLTFSTVANSMFQSSPFTRSTLPYICYE